MRRIPDYLWRELSPSQRNEIVLRMSSARIERERAMRAPVAPEKTDWVMKDYGLLQQDEG